LETFMANDMTERTVRSQVPQPNAGLLIAQDTSEVFDLKGTTVIGGSQLDFSLQVLVPNRVGAEVLIPDATTSGGYLRLRDEQGAPIVRETNESAHDAYVRATSAVLAYIDDGRLEVKNGTLSPTEKFFERRTEEPSLAGQPQSWDVKQMYAGNLASVQAAKQSQTPEIVHGPS
jgi:hypothetical protein